MLLFDLETVRVYFFPPGEDLIGEGSPLLIELAVAKNLSNIKSVDSLMLVQQENMIHVYSSGNKIAESEAGAFDEFPEYNLKEVYDYRFNLNPHMLTVLNEMVNFRLKDDARPVFNGVIFNKRLLSCTDTHRMVYREISPVDFNDFDSITQKRMTKLKFHLGYEFIKNLPRKTEMPFTFRINETGKDGNQNFRIDMDDFAFISHTWGETIVNPRVVIPHHFFTQFVLFTPTIINNIRMAIATNAKKMDGYWEKDKPEEMEFRSINTDTNQTYRFVVKVVKPPKDLVKYCFSVNPKFLHDIILWEDTKYLTTRVSKYDSLVFDNSLLMTVKLSSEEKAIIQIESDEKTIQNERDQSIDCGPAAEEQREETVSTDQINQGDNSGTGNDETISDNGGKDGRDETIRAESSEKVDVQPITIIDDGVSVDQDKTDIFDDSNGILPIGEDPSGVSIDGDGIQDQGFVDYLRPNTEFDHEQELINNHVNFDPNE